LLAPLVVLLGLAGLAGTARADFLRVIDPSQIPNPTPRAFGNVPLGTNSTQTIRLASCDGALDDQPCDTGGGGVDITAWNAGVGSCAEFAILTPPALPINFTNGEANAVDISVRYTPTDRGSDSCTYTPTTTGGTTASFTVTGTGVASQLTVQTASPLTFLDQHYSAGTGETKTITVQNTGNEPIAQANITVSLSDATHFSLGALTPATAGFPIEPMETATVAVTFNPTVVGNHSATVTFAVDNDAGEANKTVTVSGKGVQPLIGRPEAVAFATGAVGVARDADLVITNTGDAPLNISSMTIGALPDGPDFVFTGSCAGSSCTPAAIPAGGMTTFTLRCTPSAAGWRAAILSITSDDGLQGLHTVGLKCAGNNLGFGNDKVDATPTATQNITIANGKATGITYSLLSTAPAEFILTCAGGCANRVLASGAKDSVTVAFQAASPGARSANIELTTASDVDLNNTVVSLTGTGTQPAIGLAPNPLAFGDVPVVQASGATTDLTVSNTGDATLVITAMNIVNDPTDQFSFATATCASGHTCNDTINVAALGSTPITLRCDPTSGGDKTASLSIVSDAPGAPHSVPLTCKGTVPDVAVSAMMVGLGNQRVGTTTAPPATFTVSNSNAAHTAPMAYTISVPAGPFAIACSAPGCSGTLAAGGSVTVSVTFSPAVTGLQMENVTVATPADPDEPSTNVLVTGTGTEPEIAVAPSPLAFGDVPVAQMNGATTALTITNDGGAPLQVSSMVITDDAEGVFSFATVACPSGPTCDPDFSVGTGAPPANQGTVSLRCDPASAGDKTATLTIVSDAPTSPTPVSVTCTGTVPDVAVSAASLAFGDQRLNTTSGQQTFTVSNAGAPHTAPLAYQITSLGADFTVTCSGEPGCQGTLASGGSITVTVTFTPSALGARTGSVNVATATDPDEPSTVVDLTGTGVQPSVNVLAPSPTPLALGDVDVNATSAPGTITLQNAGTSDLTISAVTLVGADPGQFAIASGGVGVQTLGSGAGVNTRSWTVTCGPTSIGAKAATFRVTHDAPAPGTNTDVPVTCTGRAASFTPSVVAPARIDFGQVQINTDSTPRSFTITNTGNKAGRVTMLTSSSNQFVPSTMANLATDIAPGGQITVNVVFHPTTTLVVNGQICALNTGLTSPVCVDVTGDGQSVGLDVAPNIDFGAVRFDAAPVTSAPVTITNTGESSLRIDSIVSSGAPFTIVNAPNLPVTLGFNESAIFRVRLTPTPALGTVTRSVTVNGAFTVSGNATQSAVDVTARIIAPQVSMTTDTLDFGPLDVDDGNPITRMVTITNIGDQATGAPLAIGAPVLESGMVDFSIVAPPAVLVQPGASTTMSVRFAPSSAGAKAGRITLPIDALTGMTYTIQLRGLGVDQNVACTPATLSFPATVRRQASDAVDATVTNLDFATGAGTAAMLTYQAAISGDHASDFSLPTADASGAIAGNGTRRLPITFTPSVAGPRRATLVVTYSDDGTRSCTVPLEGDGRLRTMTVIPVDPDFGTLAVGSTALLSRVASTIKITSNEPAAATATVVKLVRVTGAARDSFTVIDGSVEQPIAMGQTLSYDVEFRPTVAGVFQADVEVLFDDDPEAQYVVHVTGRAVDIVLRGGGCDGGAGGAGLLVALAALGLLVPVRQRRGARVGR
jgi:hypothetical protein